MNFLLPASNIHPNVGGEIPNAWKTGAARHVGFMPTGGQDGDAKRIKLLMSVDAEEVKSWDIKVRLALAVRDWLWAASWDIVEGHLLHTLCVEAAVRGQTTAVEEEKEALIPFAFMDNLCRLPRPLIAIP